MNIEQMIPDFAIISLQDNRELPYIGLAFSEMFRWRLRENIQSVLHEYSGLY